MWNFQPLEDIMILTKHHAILSKADAGRLVLAHRAAFFILNYFFLPFMRPDLDVLDAVVLLEII